MSSHDDFTQLHKESGQSLVEFALVLMFVILPFMFVLIDGAVTLYTQAVLTNAAREGARSGSVYQCGAMTTPPITCNLAPNQTFSQQVALIDAARATYVWREAERQVGPLVSFPECTKVITYTPDPPLYNTYRELDSMSVQVACPRRLFFGLVGTSQITLTAQSTMRLEPGGTPP